MAALWAMKKCEVIPILIGALNMRKLETSILRKLVLTSGQRHFRKGHSLELLEYYDEHWEHNP